MMQLKRHGRLRGGRVNLLTRMKPTSRLQSWHQEGSDQRLWRTHCHHAWIGRATQENGSLDPRLQEVEVHPSQVKRDGDALRMYFQTSHNTQVNR